MASRQPDLFHDWTPPDPVVRFDPAQIKASSLPARICRAISATLKDADTKRELVAAKMSDFLGRRISLNMLNAWASQSSDRHMIGLPCFIALLDATRDRRLLEMIAEPLGWAVVDRRHLAMIELAMVREQQNRLQAYARRLAAGHSVRETRRAG